MRVEKASVYSHCHQKHVGTTEESSWRHVLSGRSSSSASIPRADRSDVDIVLECKHIR
jgi:hypothetical protein